MTLIISTTLLRALEEHLEAAYPEEGAGFLLGVVNIQDRREVKQLILIDNQWQIGARHDRFLITPADVAQAEDRADAAGLVLFGVFHSHPDGLNHPSEFDRQWALPWFSYIITTVAVGHASYHRVWRLQDDRNSFFQEDLMQVDNF